MLAKTNSKYLVGIDEAGRGPLAGPVAVGAVAVPRQHLAWFRREFKLVKDCKQLSPRQREAWFLKIKQAEQSGRLKFAVSWSGNQIIDDRGIVPAIKLALTRALKRLELPAINCRVLLDGNLRAPSQYACQQTIIRGDESEPIIAVASIVAKVRRDHYMIKLARKYPGYQFEVHKGYGTKAHYQTIKRWGFSLIHRRSFLTRFKS